MANLFAYGTLMCGDIMNSVAGCNPSRQPGVASDYVRLSVKNEEYPGLVQLEGGAVLGEVYFDIPEKSWQRLDAFEGDMYIRKPVNIKLDGGKVVCAFTYVVKESYRHLLDEKEWSFEDFLKKGKGKFVDQYAGYADINDS